MAAAHPFGAEEGERGEVARAVEPLGQLGEVGAQRVEAGVVGARAEDGAHHHLLSRDLLHPRPERERLARRPGGDLAAGDLADRLGVVGDRLAVEGGQDDAAPAHVVGFFGEHHRVRAEDRPEQRVGERDADLFAGGEDGFDVGLVGEHHPVAPVADAQGEGVAVALPAALQPGQRAPAPSRAPAAPAASAAPAAGSRRLPPRLLPIRGTSSSARGAPSARPRRGRWRRSSGRRSRR